MTPEEICKKHNPLIEVTDKLVGIWFLGLTEHSDWLCGLSELQLDVEYQISYRFRYHKDGKIFDSKDERSVYRATIKSTRAYAVAGVRLMADRLTQAGATRAVEEILVHDGDLDRFIRELQDKPWAFCRMESAEKI